MWISPVYMIYQDRIRLSAVNVHGGKERLNRKKGAFCLFVFVSPLSYLSFEQPSMMGHWLDTLRKHEAAHRKDNKCEEEGCGKGFGTLNDLERHRKTVHSKDPRCGPTERYKCFGKTCRQSDKLWPRLDNFRAHLRRKHGNEDEKSLLDLYNTHSPAILY